MSQRAALSSLSQLSVLDEQASSPSLSKLMAAAAAMTAAVYAAEPNRTDCCGIVGVVGTSEHTDARDFLIDGLTILKNRGYDVEIIERHHRKKVDAPSGTALMLGEAVAAGYDVSLKEVQVDGRTGQPGARSDSEIGFHAVRGGDIVGDHTVLFSGEGEMVQLEHRATDRDVFALGALQEAAWACGRGAGLYGMRDVLGV